MDSIARTLAVTVVTFALAVLCAPVRAADRSARYDFSIQGGPIQDVLSQFSKQSGVGIITALNVPNTELGSFIGYATADEALKGLLVSRDLWYSWIDESVVIHRLADQRTDWESGVSTAKEASQTIHNLGGRLYDTGPCGDLLVGPFKPSEKITSEKFWIKLIEPYCSIIEKRVRDGESGLVDPLATEGQSEHDFSIPRMPRSLIFGYISRQAGQKPIIYYPSDTSEDDALVGPIQGRMIVNQALKLAIRDSNFGVRWIEGIASIRPASKIVVYADMSKCRCNFGFPELRPLQSEHVTVTDSRLHSLDEYVQGPVVILDRKRIDAIGASTVPETLRWISQSAFGRPGGYRLSGAQFAELRGLGPEYVLVLINGRRAYGSAAELSASAFDLNSVPLAAVERIEVSANSAAVAIGTDAIGGLINIVLRDHIEATSADIRYGSARDGAAERIATLGTGTNGDHHRTAVILDYSERDTLLGADRERWADQDYRRFGASDQRLIFSAPANVRSLNGGPLPGLASSFAAIDPDASGPAQFRAGELNFLSPSRWQAIVPATRRATLAGLGELNVGDGLTLRAETLLTHHNVESQTVPQFVSGILGRQHPQNPFGVDVGISAALTGLPLPRQFVSWNSERGIVEATARLGSWRLNTFALYSDERVRSHRENQVDRAQLSRALLAPDGSALDIITDAPGTGTSNLLAPAQVDQFRSGAIQATTLATGPLFSMWSGTVSADLGAEGRREYANFDKQVGRMQRDIQAAFAELTIPLTDSLDAKAGMRHERFSDVSSVNRTQFGIKWSPTNVIELHASHGETFNPPSLYAKYYPRLTLPAQFYDPRRRENAPALLITGGNVALTPATGKSSSIGVTLSNKAAGWMTSADFWRISMKDRVSLVPPLTLLANEESALDGRIIRDEPTIEDQQAGLPGKLRSVDISRDNFGATDLRGVDAVAAHTLDGVFGKLRSRLDLTYTDAFMFADLPVQSAPFRDRVGVASELGTIPKWRVVGSIELETPLLTANVICRYRSAYADYNQLLARRTGRNVRERTLCAATMSRRIGQHVRVTLGLSEFSDTSVPYSDVGANVGFDPSQEDLTGPTAFIKVSGSL